MSSNFKLSYRPDIDGLRAFSILAVLIYHYFPSCLPGGYIGVDVFFVISGFLITGIITSDLKKDQFSLWIFYQRRVLRIFPALMLVLISCLIFGWGSLYQSEFKNLGKHVLGSIFFVSNFILQKEIKYFDVAAELKPLLHLWSLAIEEQFYIVWPAFLWALHKRKSNIGIILGLTIIALFTYNIFESYRAPHKFFYNPLVRAWQLGAGSLVYFISQKHINYLSPKIRTMLPAIGIGLIIWGYIYLRSKDIYPGWWALFPTFGASAIILGKSDSFINKYFLSHKIMIGIGLISYPLYLWHWPLLSFATIIGTTSFCLKLTLLVISFVLAFLTYHLVETPIRNGINKKKKAYYLLALSLIIAFTSWAIKRNHVHVYNKNDPEIYGNDWDYREDASEIHFRSRVFGNYKSKNAELAVFLGDSHIEQYAPRIKKVISVLPKRTFSALFLTAGGCPPIPNVIEEKNHKNCITLVDDATEFIKKTPSVKRINIAFSSSYFDSDEYVYVDKNKKFPMCFGGHKKAEKDLIKLVNFYRKDLGKEVILILDTPADHIFDPKQYIIRQNFFLDLCSHKRSKAFSLQKTVTRQEILHSQEKSRSALKRVALITGARLIDPLQSLCSKTCKVRHEGKFVYKDNSHLAASFVKAHASFIDDTIKK